MQSLNELMHVWSQMELMDVQLLNEVDARVVTDGVDGCVVTECVRRMC